MKCQACKNQDQAEVVTIKRITLCELCWMGLKHYLQNPPEDEEIKNKIKKLRRTRDKSYGDNLSS